MKRKALAITLAAAMAMGTCAVTASAADGDKYTIGICQLVQHEALDAATQGFKDEVTKELGEDAVTFDEENAQGLWAEIFPELQTLLPLISRQQCSMNFSRMQKM